MEAQKDIIADRATTEPERKTAEDTLAGLSPYFDQAGWAVEAPATTQGSLTHVSRALVQTGLKHFRCYYAYQVDDIAGKDVRASLVSTLFGPHDEPETIPHFLMFAFKADPTTLEELRAGHVIHGFVEGNQITRLVLDWDPGITTEKVTRELQARDKTFSCTKLLGVTSTG